MGIDSAHSMNRFIENKQDMIEQLSKGCRPKKEFKIGTEHEKFVYCRQSLKPVPYEGEKGIGAILHFLKDRLSWDEILDNGVLIGLKDPNLGGAISLEPGGQLELSGAPLDNVHETCGEVSAHLDVMREAAEQFDIRLRGIGTAPTWTYEQMPHMPKSRYGIMEPYMEKVGTLGKFMMFRSCTIQVNLDFSSEQDMVRKMRTSLALQPIATALFANSPFTEGKPNGFKSFRSEIWRDTDADRTGMLPFVFEEGFGFERYVDYALEVPMYFVVRDGQYINCAGASFKDFLAGKLEQLPNEKPTLKDFEDHISTIFPEVRLKSFLEMRGADSGPWKQICALPAFWVGLLYDDEALDEAEKIAQGFPFELLQKVRDEVPKSGLQLNIDEFNMLDLARRVLSVSEKGLKNRAILNQNGKDETIHLAPLQDIAQSGKTSADVMLELYNSEWQQDVSLALK